MIKEVALGGTLSPHKSVVRSLINKSYQGRLALEQGFLTGGKFPPWGKYWEFRGEMRAFENCCLFKTGDTKWFP